ncbi:MAG: class I SAM-dependent methyltransferase [Actinobacteria bacterium]|nr:class I SAM-dependent methyltransferase [Actinomycetota bacterium]
MVDRTHWFEELADHMGEAYLRYSFTKGTVQEVDFLVDELELTSSMSILDVGCGPGRHSLELARRGFRVTGIDISEPSSTLRAHVPNTKVSRMRSSSSSMPVITMQWSRLSDWSIVSCVSARVPSA